jgi:hypothetical protein
LIERLHEFGYDIGDTNYYVIDYRQCRENQLNQNFAVTAGLPASHVILGMSKTVVDAAAAFTNVVPIVGMVSTHAGYPNNVCGVSARRHQIGRQYYDRFLDTVPSLKTSGKTVYILHRPGYAPSDNSLQNIQQGSLPVPIVAVPVAAPYGDTDIQSAINGIAGQGGLLILPVDYFFAAAGNIISWAQGKNLPDFWPVTDWVQRVLPSALGGYGVAQHRCGQLLGDKINYIWSNAGNIPNPPFTDVTGASNYTWQASEAAAEQLGISLGHPSGLDILPKPNPLSVEYREQRAHKDYEATQEASRAANQVAVLINGGAATAILAFISKQTAPPASIVSAAAVSLLFYALGVVCAACSMWFSSQASVFFAHAWEGDLRGDPKESVQRNQKAADERIKGHRWLIGFSFGLFVLASLWIAAAFLRRGLEP